MKRAKVLGIVGMCLLVVGLATSEVGYRYERSKIPPEQIGRMTDTDWIGADWIGVGTSAMVVGLVLTVAAIVINRRNS